MICNDSYKQLDQINNIEDIKKLSRKNLNELAGEIRSFLLNNISNSGGHLASNLGVVELTMALHYSFDLTRDKIIWDVGHQSYVHKILTGRKNRFGELRRFKGLSGFPKFEESETDVFNTGHSSTAISAALGMARARDLRHEKFRIAAVVGDASISGGMAFEALNDAGTAPNDLLVVLNDNRMSISENVGGLSKYLSRIDTQTLYFNIKHETEMILRRIPFIGSKLTHFLKRLKKLFKGIFLPGIIFEELGFKYFGPFDGHDTGGLIRVLNRIKRIEGPILMHVVTVKGKGYEFAEKMPGKFHGIAPFETETGELNSECALSFAGVFGDKMMEIASGSPEVVAVSAAMTGGTGLEKFAKAYPGRFFDVGIAEQHAITMACGMARGGMKPVVAIYSTFLQRAYDQLLHDLCIQNLHVVLAIDRAGVVGEDGETHQGLFDLSFLRSLPNMTIMAPAVLEELPAMLDYALFEHTGPIAIRYPKDADCKQFVAADMPVESGRAVKVRKGHDVTLVSVGTMLGIADKTAKILSETYGISADLINARFIKPLDGEMIAGSVMETKTAKIVTFEDNIITGGFGSAVLEMLNDRGCHAYVKMIGFPDEFIPQGKKSELFSEYGIEPGKIARGISCWLSENAENQT